MGLKAIIRIIIGCRATKCMGSASLIIKTNAFSCHGL